MPQGKKGMWAMVDVGPVRYVQWRLHITIASEWESDQKCMAPDFVHP